MLASGRELLEHAQRSGGAVGAFNTYNLETTRAIVAAAESQGQPIILALGQGALDHGGLATLSAVALAAAREAAVPVAVHLDHGADLAIIRRCIDAGFTSLMIDGSALAFAENVRLTRQAVAAAADLPVEGELGGVAGDEDHSGCPDAAGAAEAPAAAPIPMTDPEQATEFVARTGVTSLAVAIGNAHGYYKGEPVLDFERLAALQRSVPVPLVLHGASGLSDADLRRAIGLGVHKINVNTELRHALFDSLSATLAEPSSGYDVTQLFGAARLAMQGVVEQKIALFAGG